MILSRLSIVGRPIAAALMTTGIAVATAPPGPEPTFERPTVETISLGPDTVWFCGFDGGTRASYLWIRATREWRRGAVTDKAPCANGRPTPRADELSTMHPARGLAIEVMPPTDSDGAPIGRRYLRVLDSTNGRTMHLWPKVDASLIELLSNRGNEVGKDQVSADVGRTVANDSLLWIGLAGGFAGAQGELGGIFRIDRRTGASEFLVDSVLSEHTITGAASVGRWVWFATENPAEYGPYGDAGLLRLDGTTRQWRQYTNGSSLIPDALIRTMESDGKILALATENGLAVIELRQPGAPATGASTDGDDAIARWNVRYFAPAFSGDSMIFDLGSKAQAALSAVAEAPFMLAQRFAPRGHQRPLYLAATKLPASRLTRGAYADLDEAAEILADTSLVPALLPLLAMRGGEQVFPSLVLGALGARAPKSAVDAMRAAFLDMDTAKSDQIGLNRLSLGRSLTTMGDSTAVYWARATLDTAVRRKGQPQATSPNVRGVDATSAIEILGHARDRVGLTLIMAVAPPRSVGTDMERQIVIALANYDEPLAWGALIALGRRHQLPLYETFDALEPSALKDPTVAARLRDFIREGIADSAGQGIRLACVTVQKLRLVELAPMLVSALQPGRVPNGNVVTVIETLVSLSGRRDSPVYTTPLPPMSVHDWWQRWLDEQHGNLVAAEARAGEKAVDDWNDRLGVARRR